MLYFAGEVSRDHVKVGTTRRHPSVRLAELQRGSSQRLVLRYLGDGGPAEERAVHRALHAHRIGCSEWFGLPLEGLQRFVQSPLGQQLRLAPPHLYRGPQELPAHLHTYRRQQEPSTTASALSSFRQWSRGSSAAERFYQAATHGACMRLDDELQQYFNYLCGVQTRNDINHALGFSYAWAVCDLRRAIAVRCGLPLADTEKAFDDIYENCSFGQSEPPAKVTL